MQTKTISIPMRRFLGLSDHESDAIFRCELKNAGFNMRKKIKTVSDDERQHIVVTQKTK